MPTKTLRIPTPDGQADAFAAFPDGDGPHPAVLMYMDAIGLRPVLRDMAATLAAHGYYVLVPNLFYRHGPAPVVELPDHIGVADRQTVFGKLMPIVAAHTTDHARTDAEAYLGFLADQPEVRPGPVAATGYCMGAVLALRAAAACPDRVAAVAGFHPGPVVTDEADSPHRLLSGMRARVHLGFSPNDITAEPLGELNRAFDAAGVGYTTEIYPDTVHGFTMADTAAFDPAAFQRHWDRLLSLLDHTLVAR
ncbi:dienelactone hydrolase family protein [Actinokineospora enzanensis]|uniref:dienelactone hydrolase family protein n=1 Tax=Actinokineospora enzanensis TaxID=155975 RepID=UPI00036912D4|nr:dienelactone hydrolase family protein [Actinokineospora enzanensis]